MRRPPSALPREKIVHANRTHERESGRKFAHFGCELDLIDDRPNLPLPVAARAASAGLEGFASRLAGCWRLANASEAQS